MKLICFRLSGRFGHFLRAEAAVSALTYPVPPRTAILGIIGAVLGIGKDQPQKLLEPAFIALQGKLPETFWHKTKLRKDPPNPLPLRVTKNQKADKSTKPEKASLIWQEWLFNPCYTVWAGIPQPYQDDLEIRLIEKRWYFQPCLGLSEMLAELEYLSTDKVSPLPEAVYHVSSVVSQDKCTLDMNKVFSDDLVIHQLRMPRAVSPGRVFYHASYFMERDGKPIPVKTDCAFQYKNDVLVFL